MKYTCKYTGTCMRMKTAGYLLIYGFALKAPKRTFVPPTFCTFALVYVYTPWRATNVFLYFVTQHWSKYKFCKRSILLCISAFWPVTCLSSILHPLHVCILAVKIGNCLEVLHWLGSISLLCRLWVTKYSLTRFTQVMRLGLITTEAMTLSVRTLFRDGRTLLCQMWPFLEIVLLRLRDKGCIEHQVEILLYSETNELLFLVTRIFFIFKAIIIIFL